MPAGTTNRTWSDAFTTAGSGLSRRPATKSSVGGGGLGRDHFEPAEAVLEVDDLEVPAMLVRVGHDDQAEGPPDFAHLAVLHLGRLDVIQAGGTGTSMIGLPPGMAISGSPRSPARWIATRDWRVTSTRPLKMCSSSWMVGSAGLAHQRGGERQPHQQRSAHGGHLQQRPLRTRARVLS